MTTLLDFVLAGATHLDPAHGHEVIARAVAHVVESERPLFKDDADRHRTASLVLAVAWREGSLRASVVGDCEKSKPGEACKGTPRSFCSLQIHVSSGGSQALNDDPELCIRAGLAMLRTSMSVCPSAPLAWYAAGPKGCDNERAQRISRDRLAVARRVFIAATALIGTKEGSMPATDSFVAPTMRIGRIASRSNSHPRDRAKSTSLSIIAITLRAAIPSISIGGR